MWEVLLKRGNPTLLMVGDPLILVFPCVLPCSSFLPSFLFYLTCSAHLQHLLSPDCSANPRGVSVLSVPFMLCVAASLASFCLLVRPRHHYSRLPPRPTSVKQPSSTCLTSPPSDLPVSSFHQLQTAHHIPPRCRLLTEPAEHPFTG